MSIHNKKKKNKCICISSACTYVFLFFCCGCLCSVVLWDPHCRVLVRLCLCFVLLCLDCGRPYYRVLVIMFELWVSSLVVVLMFMIWPSWHPVLGHVTRHLIHFNRIKRYPCYWNSRKTGLISTCNYLEESEILSFTFVLI